MKGYLHPFHAGEETSQEFGSNPGLVINGITVNPPGGHTGQDKKVFTGTPVHAAADGIIDAARTFPDYNNEWLYGPMGGLTVVLNCGEHSPSFGYSHLSRALVREGDRVKKGQIIALSGNSGTATTGDHCHIEALPPYWNTFNGTYGRVDPRLYFTEYPTIDTEDEEEMKESDFDRIFANSNFNGDRVIRDTRAQLAAVAKLINPDIDEEKLAAALLAQGKVTVEPR